jgi:hypothetical protein
LSTSRAPSGPQDLWPVWGLLVRPANRTSPVITPILAIGTPVLAPILAIGTPVLTSIPAILAPVLAPHHPGRLGLGI